MSWLVNNNSKLNQSKAFTRCIVINIKHETV